MSFASSLCPAFSNAHSLKTFSTSLPYSSLKGTTISFFTSAAFNTICNKSRYKSPRDTKPSEGTAIKLNSPKEALNATPSNSFFKSDGRQCSSFPDCLSYTRSTCTSLSLPFNPASIARYMVKSARSTVCKERPSNGSKYFLKSFITKFR